MAITSPLALIRPHNIFEYVAWNSFVYKDNECFVFRIDSITFWIGRRQLKIIAQLCDCCKLDCVILINNCVRRESRCCIIVAIAVDKKLTISVYFESYAVFVVSNVAPLCLSQELSKNYYKQTTPYVCWRSFCVDITSSKNYSSTLYG